jgi:hypothetical protein
MSKAKTPAKVIKTAIKRIETRWTQSAWCTMTPDGKGGTKWMLCMEGALFNGHQSPQTQAQRDARDMIVEVLKERGFSDIPTFNDVKGRKVEEAIEILKLTLIRIETGGFDDVEDDYISEEETEELLT